MTVFYLSQRHRNYFLKLKTHQRYIQIRVVVHFYQYKRSIETRIYSLIFTIALYFIFV